MAFGLEQMDCLTKEEIGIKAHFMRLMNLSGTFSRRKQTRLRSAIIWSVIYVPIILTLVATCIHFRKNFDLSSYALHHAALITIGFIVNVMTVCMYWKEFHDIMDGSTMSYNYDSGLVKNFAQQTIHERFKLSGLLVKLVSYGSVGVIIEVQIFFAIEAFYLQTYKTIFPMYVPMDLDDPFVFTSVVIWQELVVIYTTYLPLMLAVLYYNAWSHLDIEIKILTFAVANIQRIVEEESQNFRHEGIHRETLEAALYETYSYHFAKHHAHITSYFELFSKCVKLITLLLFTMGPVCLVTVGLSLLSDNIGIRLKLFWFLVIQLIMTYAICWIGQYIADVSTGISEVLVTAPWWLMPKSCRSTFLLIMTRCRKPLQMTTDYGVPANMESFMDLLKGVYQIISVVIQMRDG
uniref:Odorant receptor n=1 Tax=Apolygus lucorum TaxID=248454 RepID=A0A1Q1NIL0_APOLU|nr:olfactory receptor [Apolygus lucorum]